MEVLLQKGIDVDILDYRHRSALVHAVILGKTESVRFLLEHGADANCSDSYGVTLLHLALKCKKPETELIKLLIEYGCDVNAHYCFEDCSPLHLAVRYHADAEVIRLMAENGAKMLEEDIFGMTAFQLFVELGAQDDEVLYVFCDVIDPLETEANG